MVDWLDKKQVAEKGEFNAIPLNENSNRGTQDMAAWIEEVDNTIKLVLPGKSLTNVQSRVSARPGVVTREH